MSRIEVMGNRADDQKGIGRLGKAIVDYPHGIRDLTIAGVSLPTDQANVLVYARKTPGTLTEALEHSTHHQTPLLFLSSGINLPDRQFNFPLIKVPNAALNVITYLQSIEELAKSELAGWQPVITEHHQEAKADTSGTAKKLADMLGVDYDAIVSVRDFSRSSAEFDIPEASRDGYAVHYVTFTNPQTGETFTPDPIVVRGREVYAQGIIDIYHALIENSDVFTPGTHDIVQLVKSGVVRATATN